MKTSKKRKAKKSEFSVLPEGPVVVVITEEEEKESKKGDKGLFLHFKIKKGSKKQKGNTVKIWYNIGHPDQKTKTIAYEELDNIAFACGLKKWSDTKKFHGIPMSADLEVDGQYNRVANIEPISGKKSKSDDGDDW